jgi:hypothetical protein
MSKFNTKAPSTKVENLAGGLAHKQTEELELVSILLTSFVKDQAYRSADDTTLRLKALIRNCNKEFIAKAGIYARTKFGMRSITHILASELAQYISGQEWAKRFYDKIVYRPDDMLEILAYHYSGNAKKGKNGKGMLTNAMRKGFASAFDRYDSYSLAKYKGEGKSIKLIDVVNAVRPTPTEKNAEALRKLIKGELISTETWEAKLSKAGQDAENETELKDLKAEAWKDLIENNKIKYFALLRNLRNILNQAPGLVEKACELLVDEKSIKRSLVLPFRFTTAVAEIEKINDSKARKVVKALNQAVDISCANVPKFDGETLVAIDVSGSMNGRPSEIAGLFGAILAKANDADVIRFENDAKYKNINSADSVLTIAKQLTGSGGGTNFHSIFQTANKKYDRIIILSDMQGWIGHDTPTASYEAYKKKYGANPHIYSFDLAGHGTMQFPQNRVYALAGFSEKIFDVMKFVEQDKQALINEILKVEL